jgi:hypothetical protein
MKTSRILLSVFLLALLALTAVFVFPWRYYHDAPIFFYVSWLIDKFHVVPYRDLYEINFPGAYAAYWIIGRLTGYSVLGVRILDYALLAALVALGWLWMRKLSGWAGLMGAVAGALAYLALGPTTTLQREILLLVPILCGLAAYANIPAGRPILRFLLTGLFLGLAATVKPNALMGILPVAIVEWQSAAGETDPALRRARRKDGLRALLWLAAGFAIPVTSTVLYLAINGALAPFLEILFRYLPLFAQMNMYHQSVSGIRRIFSIITEFVKLGGYGIWIAPALWGTYQIQQSTDVPQEKKQLDLLLLWSIIAFSIYPLLSGQFFPQHWLPFALFLFQAAFLCLTVNVGSKGALLRRLPAGVMLAAALTLVRPDTLDNLYLLAVRHELPAANNPKEGRVDEIAGFLETNLQPGDTVQPLDWVGGAVHAMLIARVKIATPFIYDEYFYHNVDDPYIQGLRSRFIAALTAARPRFVVEVYDDGAYSEPTGPNTSRDFPELRTFLEENYSIVQEGQGYIIYEWKSG